MDERRRQNIAYEYLCHLEEAKRWMEACLNEELPPTTELEEGLRNGVFLGKLAMFFAPKMVLEKKIYDKDQTRYKRSGLHFRHTDNTVQWLRAMESIGLPKIFYPETTDVYDRKNIPRVIYCIHALSLYLYKLGIAPQIQDLLGKVDFTEEEISNMTKELEKYGIQMPAFSKIGGILANELSVDEAALHAAVIVINEAIDKGTPDQTLSALKNPNALLKNIQDNLAQEYQSELSQTKNSKVQNSKSKNFTVSSDERDVYEELLTQSEIQTTLNSVNKLEAVTRINVAIHNGDASQTVTELMNPDAQLPVIYESVADLYQSELFNLQKQSPEEELAHEELTVAVEMLSAVAVLNQILDNKDSRRAMEQLSEPSMGFNNVDEDHLQRYADLLILLKTEAAFQGQDFLTWNDVQKCIDDVNNRVQEEQERIIAIGLINDALSENDPKKTLEALLLPTAKLQGVKPTTARHYQSLLQQTKVRKCKELGDETAVLWLDEIQDGIYLANKNENQALKLAAAIARINVIIDTQDSHETLNALQDSDARLRGVVVECADVYFKHLSEKKRDKITSKQMGETQINDKFFYYYNLENGNGTWDMPEGVILDESQLNKEEIQNIIGRITADYNQEQLWLSRENLIVQLQAHSRGYLTRKHYRERCQFLKQQEPFAVRLQVNFLIGYMVSFQVIFSVAYITGARRKYRQRLQYFKECSFTIMLKLLTYNFFTTAGAENPPLNVVRKFVHLLDQSDLDFQEELNVTRLREEVVTKIRSNQQLEKDLNLMDIKIGLLVKNRITLQDVVSHSKKLNKKSKGQMEEIVTGDKQGIKGLSKEKRKKLEAYQHFFYLLQTNPAYLAKLIFQMPQNKSTKFMDTVVFTLYNYASNQREEYLLLKLFKTALEEEIKSKVDQVQDIVTGNPTVIKMVVSFNRGARGQNALRQLLAPVVKEIIEDKSLSINTNPIDVYKAWVNQLETTTGEASKLPYDVTTEQALSYEEVRTKLEASNRNLRGATDKVLNSIISSLDNIPYGMRYIAKVLQNSLHEKFPDSTEDELLKIVGNLLYYRYMNPAIVAPDGFDIIDMSAGGQLHSDQRRNLGSVAKVLQHAASNKLFEGENAHMTSMNSYICQTYQKFRNFFQLACDVPEPEEKFNVDEYSDMVTLSKPVIYISIEEIINTHSLVLEHQDAISPDHNDVLHEILQGLGDVPDVESLLGEGAIDPNDPNKDTTLNQLAKTEISLTLTSKFELHDGDDQNMKSLMIKTKRLVVDVIRAQPGETLIEILETPASKLQEAEHSMVLEKRAILDAKTPDKMKCSQSVLDDGQLPLEQKKRKILRNLRTLEQAGLVSSTNKYQEIINDISKDIRNQRRYRQRRKAECVKLQQTLSALNSKMEFYEEQINYYDTYIKTCLDNLNRKVDGKGEDKGNKKTKQTSLKYTGARLHEKGVILEIEGLQASQFKNVMFEISPSQEVGNYEVKAKFMGVEMEKVQVHFQDLLQLQYEGVAVMKMFDKAKVNVNLLIFLINKKFHGK
uniref:IQ motif containing GTPase activating protein 2 n=1 Tax=Erpetoichthys calabaricus TaxID=27687 RepID=A0A8C4SZ75_ERPCA